MSNWILKAELKTRQAVENFVKGEEAPTAVEYGIMVALIAVVIIVGVTALGSNLNDMFDGIATTIGGIGTGGDAGTGGTGGG